MSPIGRYNRPQATLSRHMRRSKAAIQIDLYNPRRHRRRSPTESSLEHLIRAQQERLRNHEAECLRRLQVDRELVLRRKLDRKITRRCTFENPVDVRSCAAIDGG